LLLACAVAVGACSLGRLSGDDPSPSDMPANLREANYKPDILAMLRVYLNDPTQVRDAGISDPMPQPNSRQRYIVCLRLNAKKSSGEYAGAKEYVAIFVAGRLDQLIEAKDDQCATAEFHPFPEAEKLSR
jgi:hypothetical protein